MFQVEPILWLQSFESQFLTWLMSTISMLGYTPVYATILVVLIFGLRLKQSLFVFLTILICGILTDGLKDGLMFPRPSDIDIRVIEPGHERPPLLINEGGAASFWTLPSSEAMEAAKIQTDWSYGFPSGHVALATAFFFGIAFFFRSRSVFVFSMFWIILMMLSRMYLGRHFIADVLGGVLVGIFAVAVAAFIVRPLNTKDSKDPNISALLRWTIFAISLVIIAPFVELLDKEDIGRIIGVLFTYILLLRTGMPLDKAQVWIRIARVLLAFVVYIAVEQLINPSVDLIGLEDNSFGILVAVFIITFVSFSGTILIAQRLKLYKKP